MSKNINTCINIKKKLVVCINIRVKIYNEPIGKKF